MSLYSGDVITVRSEDGTYLKRFSSLNDQDAIESYLDNPDDFSNFVVEVIGENKMRLKAENGYYLKRYDVKNKDGNKITLQAVDNGQYFKRYDGDEGRSVITAYQNFEDPYSVFLVNRGGTKCKEIVKEIKFDEIIQNMIKINPSIINVQTLDNREGIETKFTQGIPLVLGNETTVKAETGFSVGATFIVNIGKLDVPYTATIDRILVDNVGTETKYTYEVKGIYKGTNTVNSRTKQETTTRETEQIAQIQVPPKGNN
ncbi:13504_t:CDS:2 [Funneliformis geosporum]|nr:13504_t:CDS:2 [Funneliformis geosporum]